MIVWVCSNRLTLFYNTEDERLMEIDCFINQTVGLIISRQGWIAVPPEHLRSHLVTKHDLYSSAEELESILQSYSVMSLNEATDFIQYTDTLPELIGGLPSVEEGYLCFEVSISCQFMVDDTRSFWSASSRKESEH